MKLELKVGGVTPLSTVDLPGRLACVLFVHGCPWRCAYCHNPHLQKRRRVALIRWSNVRAFLRRRVGLLDGVVFSGGEPTTDRALPAAMREARELGFAVGLHTGGAYPDRLKACLEHADWVGMDVKADLPSYDRVTRVAGSAERAIRSIRLLLASGIAHEFRTTWHPHVTSESELLALTELLAGLGAQRYALQAFRPQGCAAAELKAVPASLPPGLVEQVAARFTEFELRTV
jgi:anaerobic ribonucleoside-triphosphate reductase activating protein